MDVRAPALALLLGTVAAPAAAQDEAAPTPDDAAEREARAHFQAGAEAFSVGDHARALAEYERAYELSGRPELLYHLSLCHERLGRIDQAILALDRFLAEQPDAEARDALEAHLDELRARLAEPAPDPARETPDPPPPAPLAPPEPGGPAGPAISVPAIATLVAGGVLALAWGATAVGALVLDQDLEARCDAMCPSAETDALFATTLTADVLLGASAATLLVGLVLALTTEADTPPTTVAPAIAPDAVGVIARGALE